QLWTVFDALSQAAPAPACLVLGDFNASADEFAELLPAYGYVDAWPLLKPAEPGFTFDPARNPLAAALTLTGQSGRFDRALLSGSRLQPAAVGLFGQEPLAANLCASDHYGLRCVLRPAAGLSATVTAAPVHHSALVLIPPAEVWPPIQAIR